MPLKPLYSKIHIGLANHIYFLNELGHYISITHLNWKAGTIFYLVRRVWSHTPGWYVSLRYPNHIVPPLIIPGPSLSICSTQNGDRVAIHILDQITANLLSYKEIT